jgi:histone H3/H4
MVKKTKNDKDEAMEEEPVKEEETSGDNVKEHKARGKGRKGEEKKDGRKRNGDMPPLTGNAMKKQKTNSGVSRKMERLADAIEAGDAEVPHVSVKTERRNKKTSTERHIEMAKKKKECKLPKSPMCRLFHKAMQTRLKGTTTTYIDKETEKVVTVPVKRRMTRKAFAILREVVQRELEDEMHNAMIIAKHSGRKTVMKKDLAVFKKKAII